MTPKELLGWLPSKLFEAYLNRDLARVEAVAAVEFINKHPNWFAQVKRHLLVTTNFGFPIWCDRWDVIGQTIIATGQWEGLLSRTILACLRPGDLAIDIGANMGYDTMLMSTAVGAGGTVVAFEPDLQNLALLLRNLQLLPHANVAVQSTGLGDAQSLARIEVADPANRGTSNLRPGGSGPSQPLLINRLDEILDYLMVERIRLVKMDIEGFEHKAVLGMGKLLERVDYLTCEVDPAFLRQCGSSAEALFSSLYDEGFQSYCAQPNSDGVWPPAGPDFVIQSTRSHHFDALFCRELDLPLRSLVKQAVG